MTQRKALHRQPRFQIGDMIRVRHGVLDPEYPDIPLGGWVGRVKEIDLHAGQYFCLVEWTTETLKSIPPVVGKRSERDGLTLEEMVLGEDDIEAYDGQPLSIEQPTHIETRPLSPDDQDDRVKMILGATGDDPVPEVNEETLLAYWKYLSEHLTFPFEAKYSPERGAGGLVTVTALSDPEESDCDEFYGLLCECRQGRRTVVIPLGEVEVKKGSPNRQLLKDYSYWFWNWR